MLGLEFYLLIKAGLEFKSEFFGKKQGGKKSERKKGKGVF